MHPSCRLVRESGLFDASFYLDRNPDIDPKEFDPLVHYFDTGWQEGRDPNPHFDTNWYRTSYMGSATGNPLLHYIQSGWRKDCRPGPLFFSDTYRAVYQQHLKNGQTPLAHYLTHCREGFNPNPLFDTSFFLRTYPQALTSGLDPLAYFIEYGKKDLLNPSPFFDMASYLEANPTVADAWQSPLRHYIEYGAGEGCRPNPLFDPQYYRRVYLDSSVSLLTAFIEYLDQGVRQGHRPNPLFDPIYYGEHFLPSTSRDVALLHYLRVGRGKGDVPCGEVADLVRKPVISILTPVFNTESWLLRRCMQSVMYQPYPFWELCLVDDGSSDDRVRGLLEEFAEQDERIRIAFLKRNEGIAAATNAAAELATGEYLTFLDHDDELDFEALYRVVLAINEGDPDVLYSDEDLINMESRHLDTFYKPGFNRELLLNHNYITHLLVTRRSLFTACGGLASAYNGAQDYDLTLKLTEMARSVSHIPQVLYHWRAHETSTSINHGEKHYADEAGRRAVQAAMERRGMAGKVTGTELRFFYRPRKTVPADVAVTIILDRQLPAATRERVRDELSGQWPKATILVPEGGEQGEIQNEAGTIFHSGGSQRLLWRNHAAGLAGTEYLCFLGDVVWPTGPEWLHALLEYGQAADTGMIGGHLDRHPASGLHQGSVPDLANASPRYWASFVRDVSVQHNGIHCPQNVLAVDEGVCLIRRATFLGVGGYDKRFTGLDYAQIDLCFRLHAQNKANIFTPWCSVATGLDTDRGDDAETKGGADRRLLQQRWRALLRAGDPYYNRQLLVDRGLSLEAFLRWYAGEGHKGSQFEVDGTNRSNSEKQLVPCK